MTKFFLAAASLSLAFAAPAAARDAATRTFTHEGVTYSYTSTKTDDAVILEGYAKPIGGRFRFVVQDGRVTGYVGGSRVSFLVKDAVDLSKSLKIASR